MKGKITQWKDDRGFGFIASEIGSEKIFFHISSVKSRARRPQVGDSVLYDAVRDAQGRLKAKGVVIDGVKSRAGTKKTKSVIHTEPVKKDAVDYILMLIAALFMAIGLYVFYKTGSLEKAVPIGGLVIILVAILNRQKKPKEKWFACARCNKMESHTKRTIRAWNNGFNRIYCGSCHNKWYRENGERHVYVSSSRGGGCLGMAVSLMLFPVAAGYGVYQWLI